MKWAVNFHAEFFPEYEALPEDVQNALLASVGLLKEYGPQLGRPHVDTLKGSIHPNMKELRFDDGGGVWRFAFAFDPKRQAVVLCGGNKAGPGTESKFYKTLIEVADRRFTGYSAAVEKEKKLETDSKKGNKP